MTRVRVRRDLPPLTESSFLRYLAFALLYLAQGVPYGFLNIAMAAWLADRGLSAGRIGAFLGMVLLPWSFKVIYGPVMDRWSFLAMGRRRPWILTGQMGLMVSLLAMAFVPDPIQNLTPLLIMGFVTNCFAAMQDVATDGMAVDILPVEEQARANGVMWGAKMTSIAGTGAGTAWLLVHAGLAAACFAGAAAVALVFLVPLLLRERAGERLLPWTCGRASDVTRTMQATSVWDIARDLWKASILPMSLLLGMAAFSFNVATGLFDALMPVLSTQQLGWQVTEFSNVKGLGSMCGGVFGMLIGGYLVDRFGRLRVMRILLAGFIAIHAGMAALGQFWDQRSLVTAYVIAHELTYTLITIAVFAVAMEVCWKRVAATQFTLYMMIANLGSSTGSALLGPVTSWGGSGLAMVAIAAFAATMLLLLHFANMARHREIMGSLEGGAVLPAPVRATSLPVAG
jgi:PAT family beta-lactamase induction signal transducer AmpG